MSLTPARLTVLRYLTRHEIPDTVEISTGTGHQDRGWARSHLHALHAAGFVAKKGMSFNNARSWQITDAGREALSHQEGRGR